MTLRNTVRSILQRILDWAKTEQKVWGSYRDHYQMLYNEEKTFQRLRKEAEDKAKAEKQAEEITEE